MKILEDAILLVVVVLMTIFGLTLGLSQAKTTDVTIKNLSVDQNETNRAIYQGSVLYENITQPNLDYSGSDVILTILANEINVTVNSGAGSVSFPQTSDRADIDVSYLSTVVSVNKNYKVSYIIDPNTRALTGVSFTAKP